MPNYPQLTLEIESYFLDHEELDNAELPTEEELVKLIEDMPW